MLKDGGFAVSFYGWNKVDLFMEAWRAAGFRIVGHLVFRKRYASSSRFLRYEHEQAYLLAKDNPRMPVRVIPDVIGFPYPRQGCEGCPVSVSQGRAIEPRQQGHRTRYIVTASRWPACAAAPSDKPGRRAA
ncbi:hypothetical protein FHR90_000704 [Endobacter medicaginis]|uniref:Uncharacterized protein n=1 Tax=Endobacter medicaginis TaxID=1181271 RepID=A0A839UXQ8_9PROT|nr:hypothetical protein [Endobacter medicaginis]MBB3172890.1 hypothetical protein [Endobacter medicaginis]MCX5474815.1 hypothetical protein [Endobacter medicaginis]